MYQSDKTKKKTKTTIYKIKHVFEKSILSKKENNKVIAKVKKIIS